MTASRVSFEYAVIRVVPRVERGEAFNAGVIVYSRAAEFLAAKAELDPARLAALDPRAEAGAVARALAAAVNCEPRPGEDIGRRFRWLTAPRSTVVQPGPVHTGLTRNPEDELERLFTVLVAPLGPSSDTDT